MSGQGPKIRNAGALAKQALLGLASTNLGVPVANLTVDKGVVSGGGKTVTYGELVGGKLLNVTGANVALQPGVAPAKPIDQYKTVTKRDMVVRIDIPDKVTGKMVYVHNVRVPGMLHGRMVRPRGQGAYPYNSNVPVSIDETSIAHIPGAQVVQVGQLRRCGCAEGVRRDPGCRAAEGRLEHEPDPAGQRQPLEALPRPRRGRSDPGQGQHERRQRRRGARLGGAHGVGHVCPSLPGPHADRPELLRRRRAGRPCDDLEQHPERREPGHRPDERARTAAGEADPRPLLRGLGLVRQRRVAFDTAESAAIMSKAVGKPVRLQLMRWDEHGWTHYAPSALIDMRAGVDAKRQHGRLRGDRLRSGRHQHLHRPRARGPGRRSDPDREHDPDLDRRR